MWFLIFTVLSLDFHAVLVKGACTKFTSESDLAKSVMVQGRCVYGFRNGKQYNNANSLCESKGTQLIVLKTEEDQSAAWNALGSNFGQHWMGLTKKNDVWQWKDAGAWLPMTSPRWEAVQTGDAAYTMSSENRYLWKMTTSDSWYRPVCEESTASPTDPEQTDTTQAVTTQAVTTQAVTTQAVTTQAVTTQAVTTQAVTTQVQPLPVLSGDLLFKRVENLDSFSIIDSISVMNIRYCVLHCLGRQDCTDIVYKSSTPNCILTKHDPTEVASGLVCSVNSKCFVKNI